MSLNFKMPNEEAAALHADWALKLMVEEDAFFLSRPDVPNAALFTKPKDQQQLVERGHITRAGLERLHVLGIVALTQNGKVQRYEITQKGRDSYRQGRVIALPTNRAMQLSEDAPTQRGGAHQTPLEILARKTDRNGVRYLNARLISAAEQLREDYEIAEIDARITQNWKAELERFRQFQFEESAVAQAKFRFADAMFELGDGLADVAYRVCCLQEGLETAENWLGWSARSGKVVLRIALIRLAEHYHIPQINRDHLGVR